MLSAKTSTFTVTAALLIACSSSNGSTPDPATPSPCKQHMTMEAYCAQSPSPCTTFEDTANAVRREGAQAAAGNGLFRYAIGTCGEYRIIDTQTMGMSRSYYDSSGHVVATGGGADTPVCGDVWSHTIGTEPKCEAKIVERGGTP